jgi:redox-sensitive bicupin YhaK (pirin superfamily)
MEIITYVLEGAVEHKDSMGTGSTIRPGEVQRMTAGTGVVHSEANASPVEPVHLLQIWILPERRGLTPGYEQTQFPDAELQGRLRVVASPDGREGSVTLHQDASIFAAKLAPGDTVEHALAAGRAAWVQVARGSVILNGETLEPGDGAAIEKGLVRIEGKTGSHILLFDLA